MFSFNFVRWLKSMVRPRGLTIVKRQARSHIGMEYLEARVVPTTKIWSGGGGVGNTLWSNTANWSGGVAPVAGDDLVFNASAAQRTTSNNLVNLSFNSITISASGYTLAGNQLTLGTSSVAGNFTVGAGATGNVVSLDLKLGSAAGIEQFFTINSGANATISGHISGSTGSTLTKAGFGTLVFSADNSGFTGLIKINNNSGIVAVSNSNALGSTIAGTVVGTNSQLQVSGGISIAEPITVNGPGPANDGALLNVSGSNTWSGTVTLDSDTTFGSSAGSLRITGQVSDLGAGHNFTKEGAGEIILASANTYRGLTTVNNGTLTIQNALALGTSGAASNGTVVNRSIGKVGTLKLDDPTNAGFIVLNEILTINGPGVGNVGALANDRGNNQWANTISVGSASPNGSAANIGATANGTLTISGVIQDGLTAGLGITKVGAGTIIFNNANTYTGSTTVAQGTLNVRDSKALGAGLSPVIVANGATLELEVDTGTDPHGRNLALDSVTGSSVNSAQQGLRFSRDLVLSGNGANGLGALHSLSGINTWTGGITLGPAGIGVDADPNASSDINYLTRDYSLTVTGAVSGSTLTKLGAGHLIFPNANSYGGTDIQQGWITIRNGGSLGGGTATVQFGAALHILPTGTNNLTLPNNLILNGTGVVHPYSFISEKGALMNLGGDNFATGNIQVSGVAGIGVELLPGGAASMSQLTLTGTMTEQPSFVVNTTANGGKQEQSQLIETGATSGTISITYNMYTIADRLTVYYPERGQPGSTQLLDTGLVTGSATVNVPYGTGTSTKVEIVLNEGGSTAFITKWDYTVAVTPNGGGGFAKLGSQRLRLREDGQYGGITDIREGTVLVENSTALGTSFSGTINTGNATVKDSNTVVAAGATLQLAKLNSQYTGGIIAGTQIWNENLTLNGQAVQLAVAGASGKFNLTYNGVTTATPLDYDATAAEVQAALEGLSSIGAGNVTVTQQGNLYTIVFAGPLAFVNNVPLFSATTVANSGNIALIVSGSDTPLYNMEQDNMWRGGVTVSAQSNIFVDPNSRLNLLGAIVDQTVPSVSVGGITKQGLGELLLAGASTYSGVTYVDQGVVTIANSQALGSSIAGTVVANGATLQMQGSLTVAGESLLIQGSGVAAAPVIPKTWFSAGPAPSDNGQTPGSKAVTGRITSVVVDPGNANNIYIASAGGGAWRTVNGGRTWIPLFDWQFGVNEVQAITIASGAGTFTLNFNGADTIALSTSATAQQVEDALNALSSIGGIDAFVTVTKTGSTFNVTFQGNLDALDLPDMTSTVVSGNPVINITTPTQGVPQPNALFVGAIAMDPSNSNVVYIGTGETNNSTDTFYGTGIYKTTDGGQTWALVTDDVTTPGTSINPFMGKGISKIIVDPTSTSRLYVASGDGGSGKDEIQSLRFNGLNNGFDTFTISFTGPDSTGVIATYTTNPITYDGSNAAARTQLALDIQTELNNLANIGGVGGTVNVTVTQSGGGGGGGGGGGFRRYNYNITFSGSLSQTNVQQVTTNYPTTGFGKTIGVSTPRDGGSGLVINGTSGGAGVWRYDGGVWFNMTAVVSTNRATVDTTQDVAPTADAYGTATSASTTSNNGTALHPNTPGPDDDYRLQFPQTNATWSDIALIFTDRSNNNFGGNGAVLYAALGTSSGNVNNGVYWTQTTTGNNTVWYIGDPGGSPFDSPAAAPTDVDQRGDGFPRSQLAIPVLSAGGSQSAVAFYGNIKIGAAAGSSFNNGTIYAAVSTPNGLLQSIQKSADGGKTWAATTAPVNYQFSVGNFSSAILVANANTVYIAGQGTDINGTSAILRTTDGGGTWTNIAVGGNGDGPRVGVHSMVLDNQGRLLVGTNGGLWRLEANGNWTDLNGNLEISLIAGVATSPTDINVAFAGGRNTGLSAYTNGTVWNQVDNFGGAQVAIDPNNPNNIYYVQEVVGSTAVLRRSLAGGATGTFSTVLAANRASFGFALDTVNTSRLVAAGGSVQESLNQGTSWVNLNAPIPVANVAIAAYQGSFVADTDFPLVFDKGANTYDPDTVYATDGDSIYLTKNHGTTWVDRTSDLAGLGGLVDIIVDPTNRDTVYVVQNLFGASHVWQTIDAGLTWNDITGNLPNLPTWTVALDSRTGNLYVGTDNGIYLLPAGGTDWQRFGAGLPNVQVRDIDINQTTNVITIGTYGRGVFQLFLDNTTANGGALRAISGTSQWTGPVTLTGNTVIAADGNPVLQNGLASASLDIIGVIQDDTVGANHALTKIGQGNITFSGSNTYGGVTTVAQGALIAHNSHALGDSSPAANTIVVAGAVLQLQSDLEAEHVVLNGDGILFNDHYTGALRNISNNNTFTGEITLNTNSTIGVDTGGSLTIGSKAGLTGTGTIIDNGANRQLTKELTGTLTLASANTYGGKTEVNQGALQVSNANALGTTTNGTDVFDGAQLQISGGITVVGEALTLSGTGISGTGAILNTGGNNTWQGPVTLKSNPVLLVPSGNPATTPPNVIAFGSTVAGDNLTIDGAIGQTGGNFGVQKVGLGNVTFAQADTYAGATTVSAGVLRIQNSASLGTTAAGTTVVAGAALELDGTLGNLTVGNEALTINGNGVSPANLGVVRNIAGNNTWAGSVTLQNNPALNNATIGVDAGTSLTVNGTVQDPAPIPVPASSLTKVGTGTLVFPNANTYNGQTFINAGVVNIRNAASLGANTPEVQTVTVLGASGTFTLTFKGQTIAAPLSITATAAQVQTALEALSTIGTGNVNVTKVGSVYTVTFIGSLLGFDQPQLTGTGSAAVSVAVATVTNSAQGTVVADGASLQVQGGINVSTEALTLNGLGFNSAGALENVSGSNTWGRAITLASDSSIGVDAAADTLTVSQSINQSGGSFGITKIGAGTLAYTGGATTSNTYTGLTQVDNGALTLNKTGGAVALNGNLTIGDSTGAAGSAIVRWLADNQVVNTANVTVNSDGLLNLNAHTEAFAQLAITDGTATTGAAGNLSITGLSMTGGTLTSAAGATVNLGGDVTATSDAAGSATIAGPGALNLGSTTRTFDVGDGTKATDLLIGATITGSGAAGITKTGAGRLELDAANTFPGTTTVSAGDLQVDGSVGPVAMGGGSLSGIGTVGGVAGAITSAVVGTVAPGDNSLANPIGTLTTGSVVLGSTSTFDVDLNHTTVGAPVAGVDNDLLNVNGTIDITGADLTGVAAPSVLVGDSFTIIQATGGVTGQFLQGSIVVFGGSKFSIDYSDNTKVVLHRIKAESSTVIESSAPSPSIFGQQVTFVAVVTPETGITAIPDQLVSFYDGTPIPAHLLGTAPVLNVSGLYKATFQTADVQLTGGTHTITAVYDVAGTDIYLNSSTSVGFSHTVAQRGTTTTITNSSLNPSTFGDAVTFTATVTPTISGVLPTGLVTFKDGSTVLGTGLLADNGFGVATTTFTTGLTQLGGGARTITAVYDVADTDGNFATSTSANFTQTVQQHTSTTTITNSSLNPSTFGQVVTFTATVTPNVNGVMPTGTVTFKMNGSTVLGTMPLSDVAGVATATYSTGITQLPGGSQVITAVYNADANYETSTSSGLTQTVNQAATTTTIISSNRNASTFGQTVTFTVRVTPTQGTVLPSGVVSFYDGVTDLAHLLGTSTTPTNVAGIATATFTTSATALLAGSHNIIAVYDVADTDKNYASSTSSSFSQTVNKAATTSTITATTANPSPFGNPVTFTVTVTPAQGTVLPTGTLSFYDNVGASPTFLGTSTSLTNVGNVATATFTTTNTQLATGTHFISAVYTADSNYLGSTSANFTQVISKAASVTTVASSTPNPSNFGQTVQFTITVTPGFGATLPTGVVALKDGNTTLVSNLLLSNVAGVATATYTTTATQLLGGNRIITAVYSGDASYAASTSPNYTQTVNKASTSTTVTSGSPNPSTFGQTVTLTATVAPNVNGVLPTGLVTFKDGATTLGTGSLTNIAGVATATFITGSTQLAVGTRTITAVYAGDTNYDTSTSGSYSQVVNKSTSAAAITQANPNPSSLGDTVVFTVAITPSYGSVIPTGTVDLYEGATYLGTTNSLANVAGTATATYSAPGNTFTAVGSHLVHAVYAGDGSYNGSTSTDFTVIVKPVAPTVTTPSTPIFVGGAVNTSTVAGTTVDPNALIQIYRDVNGNGQIDAGDTVVGSQQLSGGATNFSITVPISANSANKFLATSTVLGIYESLPTTVPTITHDSIQPTVAISAPSLSITNNQTVSFTVTYTDPNFDFSTLSVGDVVLNKSGTANGTILSVSGTGNTRLVTVGNIVGNGTLSISIVPGTGRDLSGNLALGAGPSAAFTVDNIKPTLTVSAPSAATTKGGPVNYYFTYADANLQGVTLTANNLVLGRTGTANGQIVVTGSGRFRTVSIVNITGTGSLYLRVSPYTSRDLAGNLANGFGPSKAFTVTGNRALTITQKILAPANIGGTALIAIDIYNTGSQVSLGTTIWDRLPSFSSINLAQSTAGWVYKGNGVAAISTGNIAAGGHIRVLLAVNVSTSAPFASTITNMASVYDALSGKTPVSSSNLALTVSRNGRRT